MVGPVFATTPYRRWLAIRYNFCVSTKGVTLQQQPATSLPLKKRPDGHLDWTAACSSTFV
ncbi:MAG: hypothetical protein JWQ49_6158 [Edaphobacter sp.]|nr:hypothetical protein [Edaphobacter sp.]